MVAVGQRRVYLVGAGPGDPGLITLKGIHCLQKADVVVFDRLINRSLLGYARRAELIDVGKEASHHTLPQDKINQLLVDRAQSGQVVVRLKGGDPFVFGRGGEEAQALTAAGIPFEVVPGVTSAIAVPAYAGIPVTHRGVAASAVMVTGHHADCAKGTALDSPDPLWQRAACGADTLVFLMGVTNLSCIVEQLLDSGRPAHTPVALIEQGASPFQQVAVGTLADICQNGSHIRPPAVIVVGEVVNLRRDLLWFDRKDSRPLFGRRIINLRAENQPPEEENPWETEPWDLMFAEMGVEALNYMVACVQPVPDRRQVERVIDQMALSFGWSPAYDRVIFADGLAVSHFFQQVYQLGCDARLIGTAQVVAAESTSEKALRHHGIRPDLQLNCPALPQILAHLRTSSGQRTLLLCSDWMKARFSSDQNGKKDWVESIAVYQAAQVEVVDPGLFSRLIDRRADIVILYSPAAVRGLSDLLTSWGRVQKTYLSLAGLLGPFTVVCTDPVTAETAGELGIRVDIVPETANPDCLSEALERFSIEKTPQPAAGLLPQPG